MSNLDDFNAKKIAITAIEDPKKPSIPIGIYNQEAEDLDRWCGLDTDILVGGGLDPLIIADLPIRTGACRYAQSLWAEQRSTLEEAEKRWNQESDAAYDLRDELLHDFRHAYEESSELMKGVRAIADGDGDADMIQDLSDIEVFGKAHPDELAAINFDMTKLDMAATTSDEMGPILAAANGDDGADSAAKLLRDQAYTYLKQAVDLIRKKGKYKFWKNPERLKGYRSAFIRKRK